jgi:aspartyl-tRNA(Asn)/glutamyl-tRNA(Gln) amidotransferase subunit A
VVPSLSLFDLSLKEISQKLSKKQLSVTELVDFTYQRIAKIDHEVKAFLTLDEKNARETAQFLDQENSQLMQAREDEKNLLRGIPIGIKDNIMTEGVTTTCASQFLSNFKPVYNATVVEKLKAAKTLIIGKLNMDEFAMGSSTEKSSYQKTRNPWNLDFVPGGSSGGSAAAVASGQVYFTLGSDTGGSIRQPAAYCGVVGMKPTYGTISRFGLVAFASSLDQIGPLTKNVEDAAYLMQAITGHDTKDSTSLQANSPRFVENLTGDVKGLRIAVPKEYMDKGVEPEVKDRIISALKVLEQLGAICEEVSLPHSEYAVATYYIIASSEASSNLARFDGVRYGVRTKNPKNLLDLYQQSRSEGFGPEVKRRIMLGTYSLSSGYYDAYYLKAQKVRTLIKQDFDHVFEKYDVVIGPTTPSPAFRIGEKVNDPLTMYLNDILTIPVNLAGLPAISIPCGFVRGLPVGLQIIGKRMDDATVLRVAHAFEQHTDHHKQRPQIYHL